MLNELSTNSNRPTKGFWERPEGMTGMIVLAAGVVGLYFALPFLLTLMAGLFALLGYTIGVVVLLAILAGLITILSDRKFRVLMSLGFKMVMRKLTNAIVTIDPIGVMEIYVGRMKEKRLKVAEARSKLKAQLSKLDASIEESGRNYNQYMGMAEEAKEQGNARQVQLNARKSMRLEALARDTLIPMREQISLHHEAATRILEATGFIIEDMEDDIRVRKIRKENMDASFSLIASTNEILHGGTEERVLYDAALEADLNDYNMKLGAVDSFLEDSRPVLEGFDMKNGVYQKQALERLEMWKNGNAFDFNSNVLSQRKASAVAVEFKTSPSLTRK